MRTIKTEKEFKALISYFNVNVVKVGDNFCIVKLLEKKK